MGIIQRTAEFLGLRAEATPLAVEPGSITAQIQRARDERAIWVSPSQAPRIAAVFSAVGIIATALEQLSFNVQTPTGAPAKHTPLTRKPDPDIELGDWIHQLAVSLALHGNAFLRTWRDPYGIGTVARVLDPNTVTPYEASNGRIRYQVGTDDLDASEVTHLRYLMIPGKLRGLGPIQAAQVELTGHMDVTRASGDYFSTSGIPSGTLSTTQALTREQSEDLAERWHATPAGRTRVLSHGLEYKPVIINPADAQFLENRRFSKTEIMDLFGIPSSLALGVDNTSSKTYANVSQDWLGFVRFRLMRYVRAIENAMSGMLPTGYRARLNLESLLRADTETRYRCHELAINAGIYTPEHARQIEHIAL